MTLRSGVSAQRVRAERARPAHEPAAASAADAPRSAPTRSARIGHGASRCACLVRMRREGFQSCALRRVNSRGVHRGRWMSGESKLSDEEYEELLKPLAKELSAHGALGVRDRAAHGHRVRRPRHGGQGRLDRHVRARPQPAPVPRRRASRPKRARAHAMVFPALRRAFPGGGRNRAVRPQLVQSRRRRAGHGLLHARADAGLPQRRAGVRAAPRRRRHPAVQILAVLRPGRAGGAVPEPAATIR